MADEKVPDYITQMEVQDMINEFTYASLTGKVVADVRSISREINETVQSKICIEPKTLKKKRMCQNSTGEYVVHYD